MNPLILTKISKYILIGSVSATLSFVSKHNASLKMALTYILIGATFIVLITVYWEGRRLLSSLPSEDGLTDILGSVNGSTSKRNYLLPAPIRLEIVIALLVVLIFSLVGTL